MDNFTVKFHSHRGQKTGVVIEYGKNLTALDQDEDNSGVYTALLPYAVDTPEGSDTETVVTLPEVTLPIVTSEIIRAKTLIMDFSDQFGDAAITEEALRAKWEESLQSPDKEEWLLTIEDILETMQKEEECLEQEISRTEEEAQQYGERLNEAVQELKAKRGEKQQKEELEQLIRKKGGLPGSTSEGAGECKR